MDPDKIPLELRQKRQWVSFKIGPESNGHGCLKKTPLIPGTTRKASSIDPSTWRTFEEALAGGNPAYCITKEDRLVFFDLDGKGDHPIKDDLAEQLLETFPGYQELSVSQNGMHILVRGNLTCDRSLERQGLGLYDHARFCIMTGECLVGSTEIQEADPELLSELETQMQASGVHVPDMTEKPESGTDEEVLEKCRTSEKFCELWEGRWEQFGYPSPSEADMAIIGIIANATPSNDQARRLFERSGLYRPDKPHKFKYSIRRARAQQEIDAVNNKFIDQLLSGTSKRVVEPPSTDRNDPRLFTTIPGGLLKELYEAYMAGAYLPLKEAALMAAIVTGLALFSRKYQTETKRALNMWLFLIGRAGCGKEALKEMPDELFQAAKAPMTGVMGGELRSSPGIDDALRASLRHCAYMNETHSWLRNLCDERAGPSWQGLRTRLTESYTKGAGSMRHRSVKVQKGDSKEYELIRPCLTIYGDCVPEAFYQAVGSEQITSGFLPRFTVLEVDRDSGSDKRGPQTPFPPELLTKINRLATDAMLADVEGPPVVVPMFPDAREMFDSFDEEMRRKMREEQEHGDTIINTLRTRVAEKVIKLATLLGVCRNPVTPRVTKADMEWAMLFVKTTDGRMASHLRGGEHDAAMHQQRRQVQNYLDRARLLSPEQRRMKRYFSTKKLQYEPDLVPWGWLRDQVGRLACFRGKTRTAEVALLSVLKDLEAGGEIVIMDPKVAEEKVGTRSVVIINCREERDDGDLF